MSGFVAVIVWVLLAYFVLLNAGYLALNMLALRTLRRKVTLRPLENLPPLHSALVPPVTVIVPARETKSRSVTPTASSGGALIARSYVGRSA